MGLILTVVSSAKTRMVSGTLTVFDSFPVENLEIRSKKGKTTTLSDSLGMFSLECMNENVIKIKPFDIESISAIKDGAAAVYGAKGGKWDYTYCIEKGA